MVLGTVLAFLQVGGAEFILIAIVALVVLGPERLPTALRKVGQAVGQVRSLSDGFRKEVQSAMDEVVEPVRSMTRPQLTALEGGAATSSAAPQGTTFAADTSATEPAGETPANETETPASETDIVTETPAGVDQAAPPFVDHAAPPFVSDALTGTTPASEDTFDTSEPAAPSGAKDGDGVVVDKPPPKPRAPRKAAGSAAPAKKVAAARKPAATKTADAKSANAPKPRAPRKPRQSPKPPPVDGAEISSDAPHAADVDAADVDGANVDASVADRAEDGADA